MLRPVLALSCCTALAAQQTSAGPAANRFVPADSCLVVHCAAPAKWQNHFAKTQVAKLVQSTTLTPMLGELTAGIDRAVAELRESGEFDADLVEQLMHDYTGDVVVSLQIDWEDVGAAMEADRPPTMSAIVALTPGEGIDLAKLATTIGETAERRSEQTGERLRDATIGDLTLRVKDSDDDWAVNMPALVDGHLVMVLTNSGEFEVTAARLLGTAARFEGELGTHPLQVEARLGEAMQVILPVIAERAADAPFDVGALLDHLGLAAIDRMSMFVDADDRHVTADVEMRLRDDATGLMRIACFEHQPQLLRLVPPASTWFSVTPFDIGALFGTVRDVWTDLGDDVPMSYDDAMQTFAETMKVRLQEDLFAHVGTELLMIDDVDPEADAMMDEDAAGSMLVGSCIGVSLRDGKAFGQSVETMLRARGLHAGRKTEEYAGTKVHRLNVAGLVELEYAITDDLLVLVIGEREGARRNLRGVLDARANGATAPELSAAVQAHLQHLPAGWSGLSVTPIAEVLQGLGEMFEMIAAMEGGDEETAEITAALTSVAGDIQRLGIEHIVSTVHTTKRSLRQRLRW